MRRNLIRMLLVALVAVVVSPIITQTAAPAATTVKPTGKVYNKAGKPLKGIRVELWRDGADEGTFIASRRTSKSGRYTFPAVPKSTKARYYLRATDPGGRYVAKQSKSFAPKKAKAPRIAMTKAGTITGKVLKRVDGQLVPGTKVEVMALGTSSAGETTVAADGTFRIGSLPAGTYTVTFVGLPAGFADTCYDNKLPRDGCEHATKVAVKSGKVTKLKQQVLGNPLEQVSGTLRDQHGAPVSGAEISIVDATNPDRWVGYGTTDADGRWTGGFMDFAKPVKIQAFRYSEAGEAAIWYVDAATHAEATAVPLTNGQRVKGLDFVLTLP